MGTVLKVIIGLFVCVVIISAVTMMYQDVIKPVSEEISEKYNNQGPKVTIILFHATWCGHCVSFLKSGMFDKLAESSNNDVSFEKLDYDKNKALASKYKISGFPTIVAVKKYGNEYGEKVGEFSGNRNSIIELNAFVAQSLARSK